MTCASKQQKKAVSNTVQENERKDGCNDIDIETFLVTLKSRMVTSKKELATTAVESFESSSKSSNIPVDRKRRVCQLMDYFLIEKVEHFHKLLSASDEAIQVIKSHEVSKEVESTVADHIPAMGEFFSACQISPADNCFNKKVTKSATNVVMKCEKVHKALMAIKNNINKEDNQDVQTQNEKKIVEKKDKKEHKAGNLNHFGIAYEERTNPSKCKVEHYKKSSKKIRK